MITWETWRLPLLIIHVLCVVAVGACCGVILLHPKSLAGRAGVSLFWVFLLGCAITGGMLYPAFETRILWEKLGYTHGLGERLFRVKVHFAVAALTLAPLLPRVSRNAESCQVSSRWPRIIQHACIMLVTLTFVCALIAAGLIRHGGTGS